jgi:sigma-54 dependent transcriptional regulator
MPTQTNVELPLGIICAPKSPLLEMISTCKRIAPSDSTVLLTGETGTGKEVFAKYVHTNSRRVGKPFVPVNCGAIPEALLESELFGHVRGAFTGANVNRKGRVALAEGGTLFLDEIGDMPPALQGKLLRVLQEGEVTRIGARRPTPVDVRVVSATNVKLEAAVEAGRFRRDLFYRLNVVPIVLPSLRDRPGDIAPLAEHFVEAYSARLNRPPPAISADALDKLSHHSWPGNIRELENIMHFALLMSSGGVIGPEDIRIAAAATPAPGASAAASSAAVASSAAAAIRGNITSSLGGEARTVKRVGEALRECFGEPGTNLLRDVERRLVEDAFRYSDSNQVRTAELLGVSRNVVRTLLKRYGLIEAIDPLDIVPPAGIPYRGICRT